MTRRAVAFLLTAVLVLALPTAAISVESPLDGLRRAMQGPVSKVQRYLRAPLKKPRAAKKVAPLPAEATKPVEAAQPVEADKPESASPPPVPMPHIRPAAVAESPGQPDEVDTAALPKADEVMPPAADVAAAPSGTDAGTEVETGEPAPFPTAPPDWIATLPELQAFTSEADPISPPAAAEAEPQMVRPRLKPKLAALSPAILAPPVKREPREASLPPDERESPTACERSLASLGIKAVAMTPIHEGMCGIAAPVAVASLDSGAIRFTDKAVINCRVAGALAGWMNDKVEPAARDILGGSVTGLRVAASYACRGRNNDATAQLSEHAFGNAIDISAVEVSGHGWIEVGHASDDSERFLSAIREAACGPFTTVLGPGVAAHEEHFHLDLAKRGKKGNAKYCK